jgi:hypothetical protein
VQATNEKEKVLQIIDEKLRQLEEADKKNTSRGNFNFGIHLNVYENAPRLPIVLKKKKRLKKMLWVQTFFVSFFMVGIYTDFLGKMDEHFLKALVSLVLMGAMGGLIFVYFPMRTMVVETNDLQAEVKKMILEDVKQQVEALP